IHDFIKFLEEAYRLQVFIAAVLIGDPLSRLARVVEVEHGGHGIDPEAVRMESFQPEQRVADEKAAYLVAYVVEDIALPVGMKSFPGIGVFVKVGSIEVIQPMGVPGAVRGPPVGDDADAFLVEAIYQIHK